MPCINYKPKRFGNKRMALIVAANKIIAEYQDGGYSLTLRQLYYQFVSRGIVDNHIREYQKLGTTINDARLAGLVDWNAIIDRTRNLQGKSHWDSPSGVIDSAAYGYAIDLWDDQPYRVEVWVEKEALAGVIQRPARKLDVAYFSCRGYVSQSEMWRTGQRLNGYIAAGQKPVIIHLGDHDPSGIDMTRDIDDRLFTFCTEEVKVERIALNMDQVEEYSPPPNPAKLTDARADGYIKRYGDQSWELDALEPRVMEDLIEETIRKYVDFDLYNARIARQESERNTLKAVADNWEEVESYVHEHFGEE